MELNINKESPSRVHKKEGLKATPQPKSHYRLKYEAEVRVIQSKIGSLEEIRARLGLSQRKICQLLMVDPSAWTRWQKKPESAPPHIYRALQWYLQLIEKDPIWHPQNSFTPQILQSFREKEAQLEKLWHFQTKKWGQEQNKLKKQTRGLMISLVILCLVLLLQWIWG